MPPPPHSYSRAFLTVCEKVFGTDGAHAQEGKMFFSKIARDRRIKIREETKNFLKGFENTPFEGVFKNEEESSFDKVKALGKIPASFVRLNTRESPKEALRKVFKELMVRHILVPTTFDGRYVLRIDYSQDGQISLGLEVIFPFSESFFDSSYAIGV